MICLLQSACSYFSMTLTLCHYPEPHISEPGKSVHPLWHEAALSPGPSPSYFHNICSSVSLKPPTFSSPLIFPNLTFMYFFPSQSHQDPMVYYIIHSFAKVFFRLCRSITSLEKPTLAQSNCPSLSLSIHADRKCPSTWVTLPQIHHHHLGPIVASQASGVCLVGSCCLTLWDLSKSSPFSSLLNDLHILQAVTSPPASLRNGVTDILQPPITWLHHLPLSSSYFAQSESSPSFWPGPARDNGLES